MNVIKIKGLWYVTQKHSTGAVCMGYAEDQEEAIKYCKEMMAKRNKK